MRIMSSDKQERFEQSVTLAAATAAAAGTLNLGQPRFERSGFVTRAFMQGSGGSVELCCGPPDYSLEIFISNAADARRLALADLMQLGSVAHWLVTNRPRPGEQDASYAFRFLIDGLRDSTEFNWLHARHQG
jgi:phosphatidylethanolamine-binding protein (PEBP) family uncharacterized protein